MKKSHILIVFILTGLTAVCVTVTPFRAFIATVYNAERLIFRNLSTDSSRFFTHWGKFHAMLVYGLSVLGTVTLVKSFPRIGQRILEYFFMAMTDLAVNLKTYAMVCAWCIFWSIASVEAYLRHQGMYETYTEMTGEFYTSPFDVQGNLADFPSRMQIKIDSIARSAFGRGFLGEKFTNQFGYAAVEKTGKTRILAIGDSFTEGEGSTQDSSYPSILRHQLPCDSFEVLNAGRSGSDPVFEYLLLKNHLMRFRPDIVIMNMNISELDDCIFRTGFERFRPDGTLRYRCAPWWEFWYGRLYIIRYFVHRILGYNYQFLKPNQVAGFEKKAKKDWQMAIDSTAIICRNNHIRLVLSFNPQQSDLDKDSFGIQDVVDTCIARGYETVSVFEVLHGQRFDAAHKKRNTSIFVPNNGHFNNKGYALMAESLRKKVGCGTK
jgi:hypothetical protein